MLSVLVTRRWQGINRMRGALFPNSYLIQDALPQPAIGAERKQRRYNPTSKVKWGGNGSKSKFYPLLLQTNPTMLHRKPGCFLVVFFFPNGLVAYWDRLKSKCGNCLLVLLCVVHITETKACLRLENSNTLEVAIVTEVQRLPVSSVIKTYPYMQVTRAERKGKTHSSTQNHSNK